ncbi:oligoribonuclease [Candidatus Dependentiae bacterium]|nr:oligoribonuclease [Candidatus Dependentiae bacterium]
MTMKSYNHDRLVWIDLEMTGLNYQTDTILEIASIITDAQLNIIAIGPNLIIHQPDNVLNGMNNFCFELHTKTGLLQASKESTISLEQAQTETLLFLEQHCQKATAPLCGNSVWCDKLFLQKYMPFVYDYLHYRIVDVTSLKVMINLWTKQSTSFYKKNTHRALDDIKESIAELQFYKEKFITIPS